MSVAIRVEHLSKEYRLGVINHGMLYKDIQSWLARKLGRPDPHAPIGADHYADQKDRFWALKDLTFDIEQGDRVGIIGRNGAGKSTLLKILSRITAPTEGVVKIKGRVASLLEVGTGFHGELTGRENIYLNGAILGMKKREIDRKIDEIIDFSEIEQHIDTPVKRYSSGMYVRLAFAVAAHLDSEILIADEVLAVGDAAFQKKALGKMNELSKGEGRTILFVSHNMSSVKQLCTDGIVMDKGRIICSDMIENAIRQYMGQSISSCSVWNKKPDETGLGIIEIEAIYLKDQDGLVLERSIDSTERIFLYIEFTCHEIDPLLTIGFSLFNDSGENIYRSLTTDIDDEVNSHFVVGFNIISCEVPISFLRSGKYYICLDCSIHNIRWLIDPEVDTCYRIAFEIVNSVFGPKHQPMGKVAPRLNWIVSHKDYSKDGATQ